MAGSHARGSSGSEDGPIVAALIAGDLSALGEAYDRYAQHLFTYASGMLRDSDAAADVVHDAVLIASQRITQLRDPDRFRPWLYAIVRSECLRHLRVQKRSVPLDDSFEIEAPDATDTTVEERDVRALVAAAAAGLSPKDREVLELSIRHDLDNAQVAAVLGVSMNQASTLTSRARTQLERSLSVLLVAQERGNSCAGLDEVLASWDGEFTPLWRKRIGRHMDRCEVCSGVKDRKFRAAVLLGLFPLAIAPMWLRDLTLGDAREGVELVALSSRIEPLDRDGFPASGRRPGKVLWAGAAGALLVIGAGAGFLALEPAANTPPVPAQFEIGNEPPTTTPTTTRPAVLPTVAPPTAEPVQPESTPAAAVPTRTPARAIVIPAPITTTAVVPTTELPETTTPVVTTETTTTTTKTTTPPDLPTTTTTTSSTVPTRPPA